MDRQAIQERFGIIGASPAIHHVIDRTRQVARTDITVLIEGESGVGKELIAHAIHEISLRRHRQLKVINTGAIPEGLIESELFGAEKGAYTGASERRTGLFEDADGGSVFLDEIGEMPPATQIRLLRVLETGSFNRVGSSKVLKTDARVIAATNKNLGHEVEAGRFREDLYYRLSTVIIRVPPLRERKEDILPIFESFLHELAQKYGTPRRRLTDNARHLLQRYRWPGNVRELRNVAEQVVVLHRGASVDSDALRPLLRGITSAKSPGTALMPIGREPDAYRERELIYRALLEIRHSLQQLHRRVAALGAIPERDGSAEVFGLTDGGRDVPLLGEPATEPRGPVIEDAAYELEADADPGPTNGQSADLGTAELLLPTLESAERELINKALQHFEGNRRQTAKALGISERTLYRKLKEVDEEA